METPSPRNPPSIPIATILMVLVWACFTFLLFLSLGLFFVVLFVKMRRAKRTPRPVQKNSPNSPDATYDNLKLCGVTRSEPQSRGGRYQDSKPLKVAGEDPVYDNPVAFLPDNVPVGGVHAEEIETTDNQAYSSTLQSQQDKEMACQQNTAYGVVT